MERMEKSSGTPCSPADNRRVPSLQTASTPPNGTETSAYVDVLIGSAAQLPANILTILIVDIVGGRWILSKLDVPPQRGNINFYEIFVSCHVVL